jgi:membrane-bound serine protease (ClpP class)
MSIRLRRSLRVLAALSLLSGLALSAGAICAPSIHQREAVHVLTYDGTVDQVMVNYIDRGIGEAERTDARAVVLRLDTPGGLVTSMETIVKRINSSEVPVIVYIWPSGGHAASAGTFITMAGHVAAMAPSTRIGAASPVDSSGGDLDRTLKEKVTADLVALITGIARERGRNADWAERAVRRAVSANSQEAVELHVVDFEARTLDSVLQQSEGRTVHVGDANRAVTLRLADAPVVYNDRTLIERFLSILSDPNIAFLLLSAGALLLLFELLHPGVIAPGVIGAIALLLAFFSLGTLPVNWAGVALILLAFVLFAAEVFVTGFGALGIGGAVSLILGGLLLTSTSNPDFQVNRWLIFGLSGLIAAFFMVVVSALIRTRRLPAYMGEQTLVGRLAVARSRLDPDGLVFLEGGRWTAHAEGAHVQEGERVRVTAVHGLKLIVRREPAGEQAQKGV